MPFLDNTGIDTNVERGPFWNAFAALFDQLERYVVLNLAWALQLVPAILAGFFSEWSPVVRLALFAYSAVALAVATGLLFRLVYLACDGETLRLSLAREELRECTVPSLTTLAPLYGTFGVLLGISNWAGVAELFIVDVAARLLVLLLFVVSIYWGALFASDPRQTALAIAQRSVRMFLREPGLTLMVSLAVAFVTLVGVVSVGGIFLIVGVLVALLQMQMYWKISRKTREEVLQS